MKICRLKVLNCHTFGSNKRKCSLLTAEGGHCSWYEDKDDVIKLGHKVLANLELELLDLESDPKKRMKAHINKLKKFISELEDS